MRLAGKAIFSAALLFLSVIIAAAGINILYKVMYPTEYEDLVVKYSRKNELEPTLVFAVIRCESSFDKDAMSHKDAHGLMQITPETLEWLVMVEGGSELPDMYDPEQNIKYGTALLRLHLDEFGGYREMLAAYHAGRGAVNGWLSDPQYSSDGKTLDKIPYDDTDDYVNKVLNVKGIYDRLFAKKYNSYVLTGEA